VKNPIKVKVTVAGKEYRALLLTDDLILIDKRNARGAWVQLANTGRWEGMIVDTTLDEEVLAALENAITEVLP
jgi:hypothetical protein